jgi:pyruvate/2-oxoglutarate dehydrogenase complex dihydrolipoamide dehydrogenase (E3) component
MPTIAAYALIAAGIFSLDFGTAYKLEHSQVTALELQIGLINRESKNLFAEAGKKVEEANQAALVTNENLEAEHAKNVKIITDNAVTLESARRVWISNQSSSSCDNGLGQ